VLDPERTQTRSHVARKEGRVKDAEGDEQLVEGRLHLRAPEDGDGGNVAEETKPAEDSACETSQPPLPGQENL
jgi:hypothetical protein